MIDIMLLTILGRSWKRHPDSRVFSSDCLKTSLESCMYVCFT